MIKNIKHFIKIAEQTHFKLLDDYKNKTLINKFLSIFK